MFLKFKKSLLYDYFTIFTVNACHSNPLISHFYFDRKFCLKTRSITRTRAKMVIFAFDLHPGSNMQNALKIMLLVDIFAYTVKSCQKDRGLILSDLRSRPDLTVLTFFKILIKARGSDKRNIFFKWDYFYKIKKKIFWLLLLTEYLLLFRMKNRTNWVFEYRAKIMILGSIIGLIGKTLR